MSTGQVSVWPAGLSVCRCLEGGRETGDTGDLERVREGSVQRAQGGEGGWGSRGHTGLGGRRRPRRVVCSCWVTTQEYQKRP